MPGQVLLGKLAPGVPLCRVNSNDMFSTISCNKTRVEIDSQSDAANIASVVKMHARSTEVNHILFYPRQHKYGSFSSDPHDRADYWLLLTCVLY